MNRNFEKIALQILKEKLLVSPSFVKVKDKKGFKAYKAQGVHILPEADIYFPLNRDLRLFMPFAATRDKDLMLIKDLPEQIILQGRNQEYFKLESISFPRKKKDLTKTDKDALKKIVSLRELDDNSVFNIPLNINLKLPLTERNKILTHEFTYEDVLKAFARDLYQKVYDIYYNMYKKQSSSARKFEFELSESQQKEIDKKFLIVLNSFDAYEIGNQDGDSFILNYTNTPGLDPKTDYQIYKVLLYRMPTKTKEEKEVKKEVFEKVSARKREILRENRMAKKEDGKTLA